MKFFSIVVHGDESVHSKDCNLIQEDRDTFSAYVIDQVQRNIIPRRQKRWKLRDLISTLIKPYAHHFFLKNHENNPNEGEMAQRGR